MEQISGASLLAMRSLAQQAEDSARTTRGNMEALVQHYVALQTENVKLRAQRQYMPEGMRDVFPQAHRLALELECLLLSCTDTAATAKWWDSANEALEQWREFCREDSPHASKPRGKLVTVIAYRGKDPAGKEFFGATVEKGLLNTDQQFDAACVAAKNWEWVECETSAHTKRLIL